MWNARRISEASEPAKLWLCAKASDSLSPGTPWGAFGPAFLEAVDNAEVRIGPSPCMRRLRLTPIGEGRVQKGISVLVAQKRTDQGIVDDLGRDLVVGPVCTPAVPAPSSFVNSESTAVTGPTTADVPGTTGIVVPGAKKARARPPTRRRATSSDPVPQAWVSGPLANDEHGRIRDPHEMRTPSILQRVRRDAGGD